MGKAKVLRIVMLGPPGAGKGTQALLLAKAHSIPHISTGEMFRGAIRDGTELGQKVKAILDSGMLVPDEVVVAMVRGRLAQADCSDGFLFDGYPRTVKQAEVLDSLLRELTQDLTHIVDLKVPESVLLERIRKRGEGRADDSMEVAAKRLKEYWEKTAPVSRYYVDTGTRLIVVDGLGTVEEVQRRIEDAVVGSGKLS